MSILDTSKKSGFRVLAGVGLAITVTWMVSVKGTSSAAYSAVPTNAEAPALAGESAGEPAASLERAAGFDESISAFPMGSSAEEIGAIRLAGVVGLSQPLGPQRGDSPLEGPRDGFPPEDIPAQAYCCSDGASCFVYQGQGCPLGTESVSCPCPPF